MRHPDVTYLISRPGLIDHSSKWDAIDELQDRTSNHRVIVLAPGTDSGAFIQAARSMMRFFHDLDVLPGLNLACLLGALMPDHPPVEIVWRDGYDLFIAGRKAGGAHTAEDALINAERLISGDLVPQQSWFIT